MTKDKRDRQQRMRQILFGDSSDDDIKKTIVAFILMLIIFGGPGFCVAAIYLNG